MPRSKKSAAESAIKEKIQYLGLNFERVPKSLIATDNLNFKVLKGYDEKQYKQYKFIKIKDIDILLTPAHRMDTLTDRYEKASPLYMYLDSQNEENTTKYATFLKLLKKVEISDVENVEKEQQRLSEELPFKVKFNGNYLWQIYYSEYEDRYFMLFPTEDLDCSTFFYLLKKKIENKKDEMIFVPISYLDYSESILKKSEIKDLENELWLFTKDYPSIYEVTDQKGKTTLQIIGKTGVYGKIKTLYKNVYEGAKDASKFFKLLKALFILQVTLPHYYEFETNISDDGKLGLYLDGKEIKYEELIEFVAIEYQRAIKLNKKTTEEIEIYTKKLNAVKKESIKLEKEYLEKEKMISTFLECKKTFFGKVKYFFTASKKPKKLSNKKKDKILDEEETKIDAVKEKSVKVDNKHHTLDELIKAFRELETSENENKNIVQDINAIKLKNKNLRKKIENATAYINEINKHKKSIFEFWKYSNKDEVAALEEGEEEEVNVYKIEKTFNYDNDFKAFGEKVDRIQRLKLTDSELDGCYLASTNFLGIMNEIVTKQNVELHTFAELLEDIQKDETTSEDENEDFDIFGDEEKEGQSHRETHRNKYQILEIRKGMEPKELRKVLIDATREVKKALKKNNLQEEVYAYKVSNTPIDITGLQLFSLNEESELNKCFEEYTEKDKIYLYRLKLNRGTNFVAISNIVLYDNKNMTLPTGMDESNKILLNVDSLDLKETNKKVITVKQMEDEKNDFSDLILKKIKVYELEGK